MESTGLGKVKYMGRFISANELDKAIMAMQRSQAALPELLRCLCEGDLWLLMPFHPEIANEKIEMKSGMPLPFTRLQSEDGEVVVAYSSEERVMEGLKKSKVPPRTYMSAVMPALQVLEILGKMNLPMNVNRGCITGEVTLVPVLLRDLADGTALQPLGTGGKTKEVALDLINPADFPTDLLQPVFELFRKHKNFRARGFSAAPPPDNPRPHTGIIICSCSWTRAMRNSSTISTSWRRPPRENMNSPSVSWTRKTRHIPPRCSGRRGHFMWWRIFNRRIRPR
jgi:hypothetical protein